MNRHATTTEPATSLDFYDPPWFTAKTYRRFGRTRLKVYRSLGIRDTDAIYKPVQDFIDKGNFQLVRRGVFADATMIFDHGELSLYISKGSSSKLPGKLNLFRSQDVDDESAA
jgi:Gene product 70